MTEKHIHVHKLRRRRFKSGNETYFCVLDCKFRISPSLALGKKNICWRCGSEFFLNEYSIRLAKPHCEACHKPKNSATAIEEISEIVKEMNIPTSSSTDLATRLQQTLHDKAAESTEETEDGEI